MGSTTMTTTMTAAMDEEYFQEHYFTYRPLSNLPTPPLSSRTSSAQQSPLVPLEDGEQLKDSLLGPSIHLVNLLPPSASLATPSVSLTQAILTRADQPLETVALAVCILDSLDSKFALTWRLQCPLVRQDAASSPSKRHSLAGGPFLQAAQLHIDSVQPELIVLAALVIAAKFTEDLQDSTQYYCSAWGRNLWSCAQLNVTERVICENLNWRIKPLMDDEHLIAETLVDMQLAARHCHMHTHHYHHRPAPPSPASAGVPGFGPNAPAVVSGTSSGRRLAPHGIPDLSLANVSASAANKSFHGKSKSVSVGTAVMGLGLQLTPVDTPLCEQEDLQLDSKPTGDYLSLPRASSNSSLSPVGEETTESPNA